MEGTQHDFLNKIKEIRGVEWLDMAVACDVHRRTLFDWHRDKYQMSYAALQLLKNKYEISVPKIEVLPDDWNIRNAARLGAIRRNELYGSPGTPEGRRRGGLNSCRKYKLDPHRYIETGFTGPKEINHPLRSKYLAELIGIILGDGSLTKYQLKISLNNRTERDYAIFVTSLIKKLLNVKVYLAVRKKNACDLVVSSVKLIQYLNKLGLRAGDKIRNQVRIPKWILTNKDYAIACLRGLIDTDGCIYYHNHVTKGIRYLHVGMGFTSHCSPLLNDVYDILLSLGFSAKIKPKGYIFLYNREEIKRYFAEIKTHNNHHLQRYNNYFKYGEVPKRS